MTPRKLFAALRGLVAGICTAPLVAVVWPFACACAWFAWSEEEGCDL